MFSYGSPWSSAKANWLICGLAERPACASLQHWEGNSYGHRFHINTGAEALCRSQLGEFAQDCLKPVVQNADLEPGHAKKAFQMMRGP